MRNRRQIRLPATIQTGEREEGEAAKTGNARIKTQLPEASARSSRYDSRSGLTEHV